MSGSALSRRPSSRWQLKHRSELPTCDGRLSRVAASSARPRRTASPIAPDGSVVSGAACVRGGGVTLAWTAAAGASPLPHAIANAIITSRTRGCFTRLMSRCSFIVCLGAPRKSSVAHDVMLFMSCVQCFFSGELNAMRSCVRACARESRRRRCMPRASSGAGGSRAPRPERSAARHPRPACADLRRAARSG